MRMLLSLVSVCLMTSTSGERLLQVSPAVMLSIKSVLKVCCVSKCAVSPSVMLAASGALFGRDSSVAQLVQHLQAANLLDSALLV